MNLTLEKYEMLSPRCEVEHAGTRMTFLTPNVFTKWRVDSIYTKEPCTLEWIASFEPDEILADIGANVGMYTIWAAATRSARVFAFEPEAQNYATLNRNILVNRLQHKVKAYCLGLTDKTGLTMLHMADLRIGASCHSVGEALDYQHKPLRTEFEQGCVSFRLDDLIASQAIPIPHHIKIDVDGFEPKVIAGARETIANPAVRSILVELNLNLADHKAMVPEIEAFGFRHDPEQVRRAARKDGPFKGLAEHVFRR